MIAVQTVGVLLAMIAVSHVPAQLAVGLDGLMVIILIPMAVPTRATLRRLRGRRA
jgi:hypothetical protein